MGRGGFGGKGGKYKKVILAVFPSEPTGDIQIHNVGKLVHFCELTPQKLPKVALFIEKRVDTDLAKYRLGYVEVSMKIFNELIKGCRKHLPLFAASILKLIRLLLEKNEYPELKIIATETFIKFAEVHDETARYSDLELFVGYFIAMCNNSLNNEHMRRRLRIQGLRGLRAYIGILDVVDELDSFVSRQSATKSQFFPTILDNMQYAEPPPRSSPNHIQSLLIIQFSEPLAIGAGTTEEEQRSAANVKGLAAEVLRDLSTRVNNITVSALANAVLGYLDIQYKWIPNTFAVECLQTISYSLNNQHNQIMMTKVLQHLESSHPTRVTQQIVSTIVSIASESTGPVVIVLSSLMKLLVSTIQRAAQTPPAADVEDQITLQQILIDCVGAVSKKFPSASQKVEAMGFILGLYEESSSRTHAGGFTLALVLAECVLAVGAHLMYLPSDCVPTRLFNTLLELVIHSDPTVRIYAQRIIHCLLLPGRSLGQLASIPPHDLNTVMGPGCDDLISRHGTALRNSLLTAAIMRTNQPENYAVILHTMSILLYRLNDKEVQYSIPLVFKMQRKFQKKKRGPPLQARSLQTLVAGYLLFTARLYECKPLEDYVLEVVEQRQEQGQLCRYLELKVEGLVCLLVKTKKYSESSKHKSVHIFFDESRVIAALSTVPALQQEYGSECMEKILARKYRTRGKLKSGESSLLFVFAPQGLPPLTPRAPPTVPKSDSAEDKSTPTKGENVTLKSKPPQCADEWPIAIKKPNEAKAVSAEGFRKILEGREHAGQTNGVTLLLAAEHFAPAASRCAESATERASMYSRIMALALEKEKNGASCILSHNMNGHDSNSNSNSNNNSDLDTPNNLSEISALRLDLLGPLGSFCN